MNSENLDKSKERTPWLDVKLGDIIMDTETNRLGWIHKKGILKTSNAYIVTWMDGKSKPTAYGSRNSQKYLIKTNRNIHDDSSDDSSED